MSKIIFILMACLLSGCAMMDQIKNPGKYNGSNRDNQINDVHDRCVGKTEDELILELGAPQKIESVGSFKIFSYFTDRGSTSRGGASAFSNAVFVKTKTENHHQMSRFYFKEGKVVKWDYDSK